MPPRYMDADIDSQEYRLTGSGQAKARFSVKPVLVPQISAEWSSPFVRGFAEGFVDEFELSPARFLAFIDGLNEVLVQNAGLAVTGKVAGAASHAPEPITAGVAMGVQVAAGVGDRVRSKKLTDNYLKTANEQLFKPRGLFCKIYNTKAALELLGLPPDAGETMNAVVDRARMQAAGQARQTNANTVESNLRPFGDHVQSLTLVEQNAPSNENGASLMTKMNALSVGLTKWQTDRKQSRAAGKVMRAEARGRQRGIDRAATKYAATTGQQIQGVNQRGGMFSQLKKKFGGGSTLWLVIVPLDDKTTEARLEELSISDNTEEIPPRKSSAVLSSQTPSPPMYQPRYQSSYGYDDRDQYQPSYRSSYGDRKGYQPRYESSYGVRDDYQYVSRGSDW